MAIHEMECARKSCGHRYEIMTGTISDPDAKRCPLCKSTKVTKLVSGFGFKRLVDVSDYSPVEQKWARKQKAIIESQREDLLSGKITIDVPKDVPHEFRPNV